MYCGVVAQVGRSAYGDVTGRDFDQRIRRAPRHGAATTRTWSWLRARRPASRSPAPSPVPWGDDVRSGAAIRARAPPRCNSRQRSPPESRTTIRRHNRTGAPEATDRGAGSDARAGSPHPLTAAAGAVTTNPAGTGTGSTRTRSVHSPAGSFQCCPRRLLERAVRMLPRQQRRHRLAAVSWHSPKARLAHRGPVRLVAGGRDDHSRTPGRYRAFGT